MRNSLILLLLKSYEYADHDFLAKLLLVLELYEAN